MGTKRVGLARTQALLQNLKRELDMNSATLTNTKGVELVKYSSVTTIPVAVGNTDLSVTLPANALVTDVGFLNTEVLGGGAAGATVTINAGWSAATDVDLLAATVVCDANSAAAAKTGWSAAAGNKADASGAALSLADGAALYRTTADTVYMRVAVGSGVIPTISAGRLWVKYLIVS
jgi:hypothetical protein